MNFWSKVQKNNENTLSVSCKFKHYQLTRVLSVDYFDFRYSSCHNSNLNGYNFGPGNAPYAQGIVWEPFTGYYASLESVEMAIKGILIVFTLIK